MSVFDVCARLRVPACECVCACVHLTARTDVSESRKTVNSTPILCSVAQYIKVRVLHILLIEMQLLGPKRHNLLYAPVCAEIDLDWLPCTQYIQANIVVVGWSISGNPLAIHRETGMTTTMVHQFDVLGGCERPTWQVLSNHFAQFARALTICTSIT